MVLDRQIEEGIERYTKYIRRMAALSDSQLRILLDVVTRQNPDSYIGTGVGIDDHISHIRKMAIYTDEQLRAHLRKSAKDNPIMQDIFEDSAKQRAIIEMSESAKNIHSNPTKFARRIA